jgi:hypothetical protein
MGGVKEEETTVSSCLKKKKKNIFIFYFPKSSSAAKVADRTSTELVGIFLVAGGRRGNETVMYSSS